MSPLYAERKPRPPGGLINARVFGVSLVLGCVLWSGAVHAEALSEADVIRLTRTQDTDAAAAREAVAFAEAESIKAGLYPNPEASWDREHFPGEAGESEDSLSVTVPVDLSPRRSTQAHLARAKVATAKAEAARATSAVVVRGLALFYDLIAVQQRGDIQERALQRLNQAAEVMARRREEGTVSGYEQARIEVEAELASSALRQTRARAERLRTRLALALGVDTSATTFAGDLGADPKMAAVAAEAGEAHAVTRSSVDLLRSAATETGQARESAGQAWIPPLSISAGPRVRSADEMEFGYVFGLSVDLPVFSRGQGLRAESDASQRVAQARAKAAERAARMEIVHAQQLLVAAREEAEKFDAATRDRVERLERAAESGYREGLRTLVELLDARRARTTVEHRRLELALSIKRAEIALRAAKGDFE